MRGYMPAAIPSFLDPFNDCGKNLGGTEIKLAFEICPLPYRVIKKRIALDEHYWIKIYWITLSF